MTHKFEQRGEPEQADDWNSVVFASAEPRLRGREIFLSASIPDASRWHEPFDPLEITSAALAVVQAILHHGGRFCYGGHPAISPLVVRVAAAVFADKPPHPPMITIYQSELYAERIPESTIALVKQGYAKFVRVPGMQGEKPDPGMNTQSLREMRKRMLNPVAHQYAAGLFIGGMEGIIAEADLFRRLHPTAPVYGFGGPGGAAAQVNSQLNNSHAISPLYEKISTDREYGILMDDIIADLQ